MGEAFVTVTQLSWASLENKACVARATLRRKATENVDARMRALRDKVSFAHAFFRARNE